jgi:lipopolysaccharide biosynthesis glycosyltransferase
MIDIVVGFDQREAVAYHTFCQSVIDNCSEPVRFTPLVANNVERKGGSNDFIYSRFLVPSLMGYRGWAIFADGDMVCREDIARLWEMRDDRYAVQVVQHDYQTKHPRKYLGNKNENYPRKNWSSLILWNCAHIANRCLDKQTIDAVEGSFLHRFGWLNESEIGELPLTWNWLAMEYPGNDNAQIVHYTIGTPCFGAYQNCDMSEYWWLSYKRMNQGVDD